MRTMDEEIQEEIERGDFIKKIKDKCCRCNDKIPGTPAHYIKYGNMCINCIAQINRNIENRKKYNKRHGVKTLKRKGL